MKKISLETIRTALINANFADADILAELDKEINRGADAKAQKMALYESAKPVVLATLASATAPITVAELFDSCSVDLPEGFTKNQVQYGLTHYWTDEVAKTEGKVNSYSLKG